VSGKIYAVIAFCLWGIGLLAGSEGDKYTNEKGKLFKHGTKLVKRIKVSAIFFKQKKPRKAAFLIL